MSLNDTPSGERLHIGFFGRRNAGKSSLVNAITGQDLAVVSETKGTTTDPVRKAMELLPIGPVLIVDTRGGDCKGRAWRNETYMSLGQKEAEDLIAAAKWAAHRDDIDGNRMAILGWSYGGYQTLYTMSTKAHPFKAGVAIAPVTDWKLYDTGYTERYMRRPQVNPRGYRRTCTAYDAVYRCPRARE